MKTDNMISLKNVALTLPGPGQAPVHILHDISLQVQPREAIGIVGPSGSGKTSLMMLIAGVEQATRGKITIAGEDITSLDEDGLARFRRRNIGIVFQHFHLIPTMSALENVSVALEFAGYANTLSLARERLDEVGLSHRTHHLPAQLSGGEQQRVALARAFATRPALLMADEPTGNLDSETGRHVIELLFQLREEHNTTLLLVTHDNELASRTERQLHMKDGHLHVA